MLVTNDWMLGSLYLLMAIMLVAGSLIARRERFAKLATMALAWVAIFGAGFVLFTFRDDLGYVAQRLQRRSDRRAGRRKARKSASRWRSTAISGSKASLNGVPVKFLVDSGATMTTIGRDTADARRRGGRAAAATRSCAPATACSAWRPAGRTAGDRADRARATSGCTSPRMRI